MFHTRISLFLFLFFAAPSPVVAQEFPSVETREAMAIAFANSGEQKWNMRFDSRLGSVTHLSGSQLSSLPAGSIPLDIAEQFLRDQSTILGIRDLNVELKLHSIKVLKKGRTVVRFSQYYKGLPVHSGSYVVAVEGNPASNGRQPGDVFYLSGDFHSEISIDPLPVISEAAISNAIAIALEGRPFTMHSDVDLMILPIRTSNVSITYKLVYLASAEFHVKDRYYRTIKVFVDAKNGEVVDSYFNDSGAQEIDPFPTNSDVRSDSIVSVSEVKNTSTPSPGDADAKVYDSNPGVSQTTIKVLEFLDPAVVDSLDTSDFISKDDTTNDVPNETGTDTYRYSYVDESDLFDATNVFFHMSRFLSLIKAYNGYSLENKVTARTGKSGLDCAKYEDNTILFGAVTGTGVCNNTARSAAVIAHELMHHIFYSESMVVKNTCHTDAVSEAYSDFWGLYYRDAKTNSASTVIGSWSDKSTDSYTWKRDIDNSLDYQDDWDEDNDSNGSPGHFYDRSMILSAAFWDLYKSAAAESDVSAAIFSSLYFLDAYPTFVEVRNAIANYSETDIPSYLSAAFGGHGIESSDESC